MIIRSLTKAKCTEVLSRNRLGRLACARNGQPYVVPIYYADADRHLYAFSLPAGRSTSCVPTPWRRSWSRRSRRAAGAVVIDGRYEELPDKIGHKRERDHAWLLLWELGSLKPTLPVSTYAREIFFRIAIDGTSGRAAKE